jgi:hypothetical protein
MMPAISGVLRPSRSDSGPKNSWPMAKPIENTARVRCTDPASVWKSAWIEGKAGRYMSIDNDGKAISAPSSR